MSLPQYQASNAITLAVQSDDFKNMYKEVSDQLNQEPNQLFSYNSTQSILEGFLVDYQSSDDFVFITNANTGKEEVFQVHGVISEVHLPPVLKANQQVHSLPSSYDSSQTLEEYLSEGKFAFTKDNQVAFNKLSVNEDHQLCMIEHIKLGIFCPGQIVNVGVLLRLIKSTAPSPMCFISHLDSVSLISWGVRKLHVFQKTGPLAGS
ncbi:uncharacterized protein EV420DRAFT_1485941 [Desarmillaria tabescens]|uniref:Uncharacterized protein n=1 Tax=Armillaria tabescens TaxID=1929756 RepID=A0AA39JEG1_ARMTA|nr:uncharacterized protein EV420DRAFT_1485941 [Desarmillaria tabescens]KAK0440475.1 hypothetical protein EV420DRAFT_1485941 [Desarmillaria tabescens]